MSTAVVRSVGAIFCAAALAVSFGSARAATAISYAIGANPPTIVDDGDADDLNPDPLKIRVAFNLVDPAGDWTATGVILATTGDPAGATLIVTDTQIRNVSGEQVLGAIIQVNHFFAPLVSFTQNYTAHIDGAFDHLNGPLLGTLSLDNAAYLNGVVLIDSFFFMTSATPPPQPFAETSLPLHLDTVNRQTLRFIFYIDELDNTINLFDSASILPEPVPAVPASGSGQSIALAIVAMAGLGLVIWRARRGGGRFPKASLGDSYSGLRRPIAVPRGAVWKTSP